VIAQCSYNNATRKFSRAFNAVFGKVGRTASEEVIIHSVTQDQMFTGIIIMV